MLEHDVLGGETRQEDQAVEAGPYVGLSSDHPVLLDTKRVEPLKHPLRDVVWYGVMQTGECFRIHNRDFGHSIEQPMVIHVYSGATEEDGRFFNPRAIL